MNEPLYFQNYTLYQSSYETNERGEPITSVFSVNYDPGRSIKYFGAICIWQRDCHHVLLKTSLDEKEKDGLMTFRHSLSCILLVGGIGFSLGNPALAQESTSQTSATQESVAQTPQGVIRSEPGPAQPAPTPSDFRLDVSDFELLAIQDGGRIKPFDTFARESVQLLTVRLSSTGNNPTELVSGLAFSTKPMVKSEIRPNQTSCN